MIIQRNRADGPRAARCPWDPNIIGPHRLTISGADWDDPHEVKMSFDFEFQGEPHKGYWEDDCSDSLASPVLWTEAASGGCWPFGVIVRGGGGGPAARSIGLAHLATKRDEEAEVFGRIFDQVVNATADEVYFTVMLATEFGTEQEISQVENYAFRAFEHGFGAALANDHKILVLTTTVNAAVSKYGHFGELSNEDVAALKKPATAQGYLGGRACSTFVAVPRATVRRRAETL